MFIDENQQFVGGMGNERLEATITLPLIERIDVNCITNLDLSGIKNDFLKITMNGVTKISASDSSFQELSLFESGVSTIDLSNVPVTNAEVECDGTFTVDLTMNGGRLFGSLNGVGRRAQVLLPPEIADRLGSGEL